VSTQVVDDDQEIANCAPRIHPLLLAALERLSRRDLSAAEACRRLGGLAVELELTQPSYQTVRVLLGEIRRCGSRPTTAQVLFEIAARTRSPHALTQHLAGTLPPLSK
jgi:hypothetical protein